MSTQTPFAALPVRQRGTLEILDTAMKLYRRYFGVLMGWSALSAVLFVVAFSVTCGAGAFLVYPLVPGAGCCVIAAAVRGQRIEFSQVWEFTKPRFGALIVITLLSSLLMGVASGVVSLITTLISLAGTWLFAALNSPTEVTVVVAIIGTVIALVVGSVLGVMAYAWLGLIPIIACLEDDKRSVAAMGRAWELMKGSWVRVLGLSTLLSIAIIAVMGIVGGSLALFGSGLNAFADNASDTAVFALLATFSGFIGLFLLFWNPIQTLVLAVLYLDLRVRKEALDLEWNSYASAPPAPVIAPNAAAVQSVASAAAPEIMVASTSGYAPGSVVPAIAATPPMPMDESAVPAVVTLDEVAETPGEPLIAPAETSRPPKETSSFSAAPSAPIATPNPQTSPSQDAFDFSSSFDAAQTGGDAVSPDDEGKSESV